jgi:PAS domain S-box-containing protein
MSLGVVFHEADGRIIAANRAACEILGLSRDEICGRGTRDPRWRPITEELTGFPAEHHPAMVALRTGQTVRNVIMGVFNPRQEAYRWISIDAVPLFRGDEKKPYQVFATFADITARKRLQDALDASRRGLERLVESRTRDIRREKELVARITETSPLAILVMDRSGKITFANNEAMRLLGFDEQTLLSREHDSPDWQITDPSGEPIPSDELPFRKVMDTGQPVHDDKLSITVAGARRKIVSVHAAPLRDEENGVVGAVVTVEDITRRERSIQKVRASEARHRSLFEKNMSVMLLIDPFSGCILDANPAACRFYGYSREEMTELCIWDINVLSEQEIRRAMCRAKTEKRKIFYFDHRLASGETRKVEVYSGPVEINGRTVLHSIIHDVTDLHNVQAQVEEKNRELALLNRVIEIGASDVSVEELFRVGCEELGRALGMERAAVHIEVPSESVFRLVAVYREGGLSPMEEMNTLPEKEIRDVLKSMPEVSVVDLRGRSSPLPRTLRTALSDSHIRYLVVAPLRCEGRQTGILSLTSQKARKLKPGELDLIGKVADHLCASMTRRRLEQNRRTLQTAMEQTTEAVVITDPEANIEYVNPAFEKMTGYGADEVIGKNPRILQSGEHNAAFYEKLWETVTAGRVWKGRLTNKKKSGETYVEDAIIAPVREKTGEIGHYLGLKRDITHELERENALRQAQRMESIGRLAGGVAHDFNNHLASILTGAALIQSLLTPNHPAYDDALMIRQTAHRASDLVRQLLTFAKGQINDPKPIDLSELLTDLHRIFRRLLGEDIELSFLLDRDVPLVNMDRSQMEQVMFNLVTNARDAMPGGGKIILATSEERVEGAVEGGPSEVEPGHYVLVSVSDTGMGMTEETRERIFDPFFTTKSLNHGTGLGLASTFGIISQAGGHIRVESAPGLGSTFRIYLPVAEASRPLEEPAPLGSEDQPSGKGRVLLVDDEETFRVFTARMLRRLGYDVVEARDGQDALRIWQREEGDFSLLITDVYMPNLGGYELAEKLVGDGSGLPIVFMSGYSESPPCRVTYGERSRYLTKPIDPEELADIIRQLLDRDEREG